jgi:ubiquinone biosynthesis protein UbiJ
VGLGVLRAVHHRQCLRVLNLFVAIIVNAMSTEAFEESSASAHADSERILEELAALRRAVEALTTSLESRP